MLLQTTITCPYCAFKQQEIMPDNTCVYFYRCPQCKQQSKAKEGSCCIYWSYAEDPCPTAQWIGSACCASDELT